MADNSRSSTRKRFSIWRAGLLALCAAIAAFALSALTASNAEDGASLWTGLVETAPQPAETVDASEAPDEGQVANQAQVDALIAVLEKESIQESFEKLGFVDGFFWPGFISDDPLYPHEDRNRVLSNRRVAKILDDLHDLSADAQYYWLKRYFDYYMSQYNAIIAKFDLSGGYTPALGDRDVFVIGGAEAGKPTYDGARYALQSMVFVSGMLGNSAMWPHIKATFLSPPAKTALDKGTIHPDIVDTLRLSPAFPANIQADTVLLYAQTLDSDAARASGFARDTVLAQVAPENVYDFEIMKYKSRATRFDVAYEVFGLPVDRSHGSYTIKFSTRKAARQVRDAVLEAAGIPTESQTGNR